MLSRTSQLLAQSTGVTSEYDVTADGQQFVMVKEETSQINVVLNWFEELKRLVPTGE